MSAYNPIAVHDLESIAALGGWEGAGSLNARGPVVLKRTEQRAGEVEIEVCLKFQHVNEVEIAWWTCNELDGYDSRDDEFDHTAPEAWRPTVALGSLISRLLRPRS
ncbi:Uncharacterised protein [Mycobacteroides abscessus subsp. abscessus]|jgi:hypothetical protein|uniref:hypothetical protein n=1 Tax=Mycobacteroides abscessus TaxID=36809 RepID=UPI0009293A5F|nr:hypothetical protein [Mycobacteroides abscessus]SIH26512.1 Uncharacterised protein [Mycobacteroides abscessus subsp. abscessus]